MDIICLCLGVLSLVAGVFAGFEDLLTSVSALSAGLSLLIASKVLSNQKVMVATLKNIACPPLSFAEQFAPALFAKRIAEDRPQFAEMEVKLSKPTMTKVGTVCFTGAVLHGHGRRVYYTRFFGEIAYGASYHLFSEWRLTNFAWD